MRSTIRDSRNAEILDAALTEIRLNGVASLTMSRLAQLTGLSRPAIYQYFSSLCFGLLYRIQVVIYSVFINQRTYMVVGIQRIAYAQLSICLYQTFFGGCI